MIAQYQTGDAEGILPQAVQSEEAAEFACCFEEIEAYSLIDEESEKVAAVFGYRIAAQGAAEGFALLGALSYVELREMVIFLKRFIPQKMAELGITKVCVTVKKGFDAGEKFAEMLGFHPTAALPQFYLGYDYQLFERRK